MRTMRVGIVIILSPLGQLWQTHQTMKENGKSWPRVFDNLSETWEEEDGPDFINTAVRGVGEELGLWLDTSRFTFVSNEVVVKTSHSTGLLTEYTFGTYELILSLEEAEQLCLVADEGDKYTYFEWR